MEPLISSRLTEAGWGWVGVLKKKTGRGKGCTTHPYYKYVSAHVFSGVYWYNKCVCVFECGRVRLLKVCE